MATGINSRNELRFGNVRVIYGQVTVDTTAAAYAIADTGTYFLAALLQPIDKTEAQLCAKNSSDGTENNLNGSLWIDSASSETKCNYFILAV